jgi:hypothetical protein
MSCFVWWFAPRVREAYSLSLLTLKPMTPPLAMALRTCECTKWSMPELSEPDQLDYDRGRE